jgi:hypothetical protein
MNDDSSIMNEEPKNQAVPSPFVIHRYFDVPEQTICLCGFVTTPD